MKKILFLFVPFFSLASSQAEYCNQDPSYREYSEPVYVEHVKWMYDYPAGKAYEIETEGVAQTYWINGKNEIFYKYQATGRSRSVWISPIDKILFDQSEQEMLFQGDTLIYTTKNTMRFFHFFPGQNITQVKLYVVDDVLFQQTLSYSKTDHPVFIILMIFFWSIVCGAVVVASYLLLIKKEYKGSYPQGILFLIIICGLALYSVHGLIYGICAFVFICLIPLIILYIESKEKESPKNLFSLKSIYERYIEILKME